MVNRLASGARGASFDVDIERGKIGEFARAIGARHPAYFARDAACSPPTFLATIFFWEDRVHGANPWSQVEMSQERGMHAEQVYELPDGPPRAGERLRATSEITGIWDKDSRSAGTLTFVQMTTTFVDDGGRVRARALLTGVETARAPERATDGAAPDRPEAPSGDGVWIDPLGEMLTEEELKPGLTLESRRFGPLTRTDVVRYQGASGDMNPVHHDEPFARRSGFPAPLGVGMLTAGLMASRAVDRIDPAWVREIRIRWKKPVFPGELLSFGGSVTARDGSKVTLALVGRDGAGDEVVSGGLTLDVGGGGA